MSNVAAPRKITVTFSPEAKAEWACIPPVIRECLLQAIKDKAPRSHELMVVSSWTFDPDLPITRAIKDYTYPPGWRILLHHEGSWNHIVIDRVARRCDDPYSDGH